MKKTIWLSITLIIILAIAFVLRKNMKEIRQAESISQQELSVVPVGVQKVATISLGTSYEFAGTLSPNRDLIVISQTQGLVKKVNYTTGDYVSGGREVVKVDDELMRAELMVTEANFQKAKLDLERFEKMAEEDGVTKDQLEKMRLNLKNAEARYITSRKRVEDTSIKAPFSGYINQLFTEEGSMVGPGKPVFELVDISSFIMKIKANEQEIMQIDKEMEVTVRPKSTKGISLPGKIISMSISADMAQQYLIEIEVDNQEQKLKGGMLAEVQLKQRDREEVLGISKRHIRLENGNAFVYKVENERTQKILITTGREYRDMIEVVEGLAAGDLIVAEGIEKVSENQEIKIISGQN